VFGFMKQSGGHINVYSEPGVGTTFRLYLPRATDGALEAVRVSPLAPPRAAGETVIAVEDNAALRRVVVRQLKELGYRVIEAEGAGPALAVMEREKVDLLFTDIVMPGSIDGFELARRVTSRWPAVKVVLTSGFSEAKLNGHAVGNAVARSAAARVLSKPYRQEELAHALREVLDA
jgi:CheY-like chemotaxis protein